MFSFVFSNWFCATGTQLSSLPEAGAVVLGDAVLRRGAVARGTVRGTAIAVHRRRNTDPPALAGQPPVGTPCKQAARQRGLIAVSSVGISTLRCPCNEDAAAGTRTRLPRGDEWRRNAAKRTNGGEKAVTWTNGRRGQGRLINDRR